ncbi:hypothetical protein [Nannocystis radixulma]|uniref:Cytochrome c domain-containing protein n=1 Tax=Nannocystis radixulma TaxID=2995305 RepID=A0ABT5BP57_9BACT|nr:hypothetical protein [Nannocystis radixulma]MDC0675928.1 hypothetical protein [Nannocystis radixulma]
MRRPVRMLALSWILGCTPGSGDELQAPLVLPLEVLGPAGTERIAEVWLDEAQLAAAGSAALVLTLHNVVEPGSAELVVNEGEAVDVSEPFVHPDGRVSTAEIAIDPGVLVPGVNRLAFRYPRQVVDAGAAVSGYRVLHVALRLGDTTHVLGEPDESPETWRPLRDDAASIERGRSYFQDVARDGGPTCSRCHTDSGADLQYYAFSDHSIVERAMLHEFSRPEAEDIASYIRSLPVPAEGRPYRPAFQPGTDNHGAAGAGPESILPDDASFGEHLWGAASLPADLAWDWPETVDTFVQPTSIAAPTFVRWLPRRIDERWFTRRDGEVAVAETALAADPSLEHAQAFMTAAMAVGREILVEEGDHLGRIDLLRYAAVKLWDWSRLNGFDDPDHGMPDGSPAFPYEVGFAFFEAADAPGGVPAPMAQTLSWWWAQLAANPGRGLSTGQRPLDYEDVLTAAEAGGAGPNEIAFLHLYGSWEESRGPVADKWGTEHGPVRLLAVPMRRLDPAGRATILRRFFARQAEFVAGGGVLTQGHHIALSQAWNQGCAELSGAQRDALRAAAPAEVRPDLAGCP